MTAHPLLCPLQENIRTRGQGVVLGTDHSVFHQGINDVAVAMGLNPFSTPATRHPQFTFTTTADFNSGMLTSVTSATVADALVRA
jgi:hypothetical protein